MLVGPRPGMVRLTAVCKPRGAHIPLYDPAETAISQTALANDKSKHAPDEQKSQTDQARKGDEVMGEHCFLPIKMIIAITLSCYASLMPGRLLLTAIERPKLQIIQNA